MAMRMPPQVAQQTALPSVNRTSLVLFGGLALIVVNLFWVNGGIGAIFQGIFHRGSPGVAFTNLTDTGWQLFGLALLTLAAEYFGENAGTSALLFLAALWLLWLMVHVGAEPVATSPTASGSSPTNPTTSGGSGSQKK